MAVLFEYHVITSVMLQYIFNFIFASLEFLSKLQHAWHKVSKCKIISVIVTVVFNDDQCLTSSGAQRTNIVVVCNLKFEE